MFTFHKNNRGQGLVEAIIGGGIIAVTAVGLGVAINSMAKSRTKTAAVSNAVALESVVVGELQSPGIYEAYKSYLKSGDLQGFKNNFVISDPYWGQIRVTGPTSTLRYRGDGSVCNGCNDWALELALDVRRFGVAPDFSYAFAYNIRTNQETVKMVDVGSPRPFNTDAYKIAVPSSVLKDAIVCPNPNDIAATGFNFDTSDITCLQAPNNTCQPGTFAVGLRVVPGTTRLELVCQSMSNISCPSPAYALNQFNPARLDGRYGTGPDNANAAARCILMAAETVAANTGTSRKPGLDPITGPPPAGRTREGVIGPHSINGQPAGAFCPTGYNARITRCEAVIARTPRTPSRCPEGTPANLCPAVSAQYPDGVWFGTPANHGDPVIAPVIPQQRTVSAVQKNLAYCRLNNPQQSSGAGWSGYVEMAVACDRVDRGAVPGDPDWGWPQYTAPVMAAGGTGGTGQQ